MKQGESHKQRTYISQGEREDLATGLFFPPGKGKIVKVQNLAKGVCLFLLLLFSPEKGKTVKVQNLAKGLFFPQ